MVGHVNPTHLKMPPDGLVQANPVPACVRIPAPDLARHGAGPVPILPKVTLMKLPQGTLILVVDGSHMLLLRNKGDAHAPALEVVDQDRQDNPPNRDQMSDAPGVSGSPLHPGRDTMTRSDPHRRREALFLAAALRRTAAYLDHADAETQLIVVAPPPALGALRDHYDAPILAHLLAEIPKDLTRHAVDSIAAHLSAAAEPLNR